MAKYSKSFIDDEKELEELESKQKSDAEINKIENTEVGDPEEASWKKRYSDARRHMEKQKTEFNDEIAKLKIQLAELSQQNFKLPKTPEELEEWKTSYPDAAGVVETMIATKLKEDNRLADERLSRLENREKEIKKREDLELIKETHPDFDSLKVDDEFQQWLADAQDDPRNKRHWTALMEGDDPFLAIAAIDAFKVQAKRSVPEAPKKKTNKADAATSVRSPSTPKIGKHADFDFSESQIRNMSAKEFDKNMAAIDEANRAGRIRLDLSGGAR